MRLPVRGDDSREGPLDLDRLGIERTSGVFRKASPYRAPAPSDAPTADEVVRAVQAVTRTWAAVLLVPGVRAGARASVFPEPLRKDDSGFSLVMRLGTWLPQAGDTANLLTVPLHVKRWLPVEMALVVPIQAAFAFGWIAVPHVGATREIVRQVEAIASGAALDFERDERRARLAAL